MCGLVPSDPQTSEELRFQETCWVVNTKDENSWVRESIELVVEGVRESKAILEGESGKRFEIR